MGQTKLGKKKLLLNQTATLSTLTTMHFGPKMKTLNWLKGEGTATPPERDCAADTVFESN